MNIKAILIVACALLLMAGCGQGDNTNKTVKGQPTDSLRLKGDSTLYGLACEGCTDSVVVFLPNDGSDPVTYNIIEAKRRHQVVGRIKTGDWIGVVLNKKDKHVADIVIDLDQLKGIWCYIVMPKMRDYEHMSKRLQARMMNEMSDSLKETFLIPREYGFWLKRQWEAQSVGYVQETSSLADESPVVYPPLGWFISWHIWNGKFVMTSGQPKYSPKDNTVVGYDHLAYDTCSIDYLDDDSLVLTDRDGSRSYYRKDNINDINKKAKAIAAMRTRQALEQATE